MTGMEDVLAAHSIAAFGPGDSACTCDRTWRKHAAHRAHVAEALAAAGFGNLHDAWVEGVATALNHAIQNDDGITLRLEHLDGRPWTNPYPPKVSET